MGHIDCSFQGQTSTALYFVSVCFLLCSHSSQKVADHCDTAIIFKKMILKTFIIIFINLKGRETGAEIFHSLAHSSKACNSLRQDRSKPEAGTVFQTSHMGGRDQILVPSWLSLSTHISRKTESEAELQLEPRHPDMGCGCFKGHLNQWTKQPPRNDFLRQLHNDRIGSQWNIWSQSLLRAYRTKNHSRGQLESPVRVIIHARLPC